MSSLCTDKDAGKEMIGTGELIVDSACCPTTSAHVFSLHFGWLKPWQVLHLDGLQRYATLMFLLDLLPKLSSRSIMILSRKSKD